MLVIYRACSVGSSKPRPIDGKINLVRACFDSFVSAFTDVNYDLVVLLDKPNKELRNIFNRTSREKRIEESYYGSFNEGNTKSFHRQLDIVLEEKDTFLLVEDDYIFLPGSGKIIARALEMLPFITPYLHPGYFMEDIHQYKKEVILVDNQCWMGVVSTTLTFGGQYEYLLKEHEEMRRYGWADHPMWESITQRVPLYTPIPILATHCELPYLAPTYDWSQGWPFANPI